ncbi:major facilitator superfamily domain-containing protein [Myxozyma melibiosi]|uniref:Major facilitator superfamily domain-containing protein n=1 Tax=Myxozyma melibiosi TaxID=54550 RepID=A0ABR1F9U2_9ASCO
MEGDKEEQPPYSIYVGGERLALVIVAGIAVFMSSFTVSTYFPELPQIARELGVSNEKINITVTVYFIMQGLTPMLWCSLADSIGRRPVYIATYTVFLIANIAISVTDSYASLMILRMLQATGSAASVSIGAGTVADVVDRESRGLYLGIVVSMSMVAPAIAPVLSGVLSVSSYGWRTIFLFLLALGFAELMVILVWMPETGRNIVGNGTVAPKKWYSKPLIDIIKKKEWPPEKEQRSTLAPPRPMQNPLKSFLIITQKDVCVTLLMCGIFYAIYCGVTVGASSNFAEVYNLPTLKVGLCFLPLGCGSASGSVLSGRIMDYDYRKKAAELGYNLNQNDNFPLEHTRLKRLRYYIVPFFGAMIAFGWTFRSSISLAVPLVMIYFVGFGFMSIYTLTQVLITDLYPNQAVSINATNNLVRCWLAAVSAAVVSIIKARIGIAWTYTLLALLCFAGAPFLFAELKWGPQWRRERNAKARMAEEEKEAAEERALSAEDVNQVPDKQDDVDGSDEKGAK